MPLDTTGYTDFRISLGRPMSKHHRPLNFKSTPH
jgi:hypothetical protein